jgi:phage major head subunit gpT-like protein
MVTGQGNLPELLWPGIAKIWANDYRRYKPLWKQMLILRKATKAFEKEQGVVGFGPAGQKDHGDSVAYVDLLQGYQREYVMLTYALGAIITRELMNDEQYNVINGVPSMLAESMRQAEEIAGASVFNLGFGTSMLAADGLSFFNSAHLNVRSGSQRNTPATASDLTQASLEQAFIDIMDWKDEADLRINLMPEKLLVAPTNRFVAEKILGTQKAVGSADNDKNPMNGSLSLIVNPFLTDPDAWFVLTNARAGATFYRRENAEISRDNEFDNDTLKTKTWGRFAVGVTDWRYGYASAGA